MGSVSPSLAQNPKFLRIKLVVLDGGGHLGYINICEYMFYRLVILQKWIPIECRGSQDECLSVDLNF